MPLAAMSRVCPSCCGPACGPTCVSTPVGTIRWSPTGCRRAWTGCTPRSSDDSCRGNDLRISRNGHGANRRAWPRNGRERSSRCDTASGPLKEQGFAWKAMSQLTRLTPEVPLPESEGRPSNEYMLRGRAGPLQLPACRLSRGGSTDRGRPTLARREGPLLELAPGAHQHAELMRSDSKEPQVADGLDRSLRIRAKASPVDSQFPHAGAEGVGVDVQELGGASRPFDAALCGG